MFRVVIVEDEPAAARYLRSLVEASPGGFEVVAVAGHGERGLAEVREHSPDLVLTDIRMPVLDGLGLAEALRREFPELPVVVVSGHQEFAYARRALALGVVDYLLKPLDPKALEALLRDLADRLTRSQGDRRSRSLGLALEGRSALDLPRKVRLAVAQGLVAPEPAPPHAVMVPGRQPDRLWAAFDADFGSQDQFEAWVRGWDRPEGQRTSVLVFADRPAPPEEVSSLARSMEASLDRLRTPGRAKALWGPAPEEAPPLLDPVVQQKLRWALQESAGGRLEELLRGLVNEADQGGRTGRAWAALLRQALWVVGQEGRPAEAAWARDWESRLTEGVARADSPEEVADLAVDLARSLAGWDSSGSIDAPESHQTMVRWLKAHFAEPLSITAVCDRFHLSQSTLSRQFRRFEGRSFHEYLTGLRLDAAESMLADTPGLPLKTVAAAVGYGDPFHFSRAFKAAKGRPPSRRGEID